MWNGLTLSNKDDMDDSSVINKHYIGIKAYLSFNITFNYYSILWTLKKTEDQSRIDNPKTLVATLGTQKTHDKENRRAIKNWQSKDTGGNIGHPKDTRQRKHNKKGRHNTEN